MKRSLLVLFAAAAAAGADARGAELRADGGFASTPFSEGECEADISRLNHISGWQAAWTRQWRLLASADEPARAAARDRWAGAPAAIDEAIAYLSGDKPAQKRAPAQVVRRVIQQLQAVEAALSDRDESFFGPEQAADDPWAAFLSGEIAPALAAFRGFLENDYLALSREEMALVGLPQAEACFEAAIAWWTTLDYSVDEVALVGTRLLDEAGAALVESDERGRPVAEILTDLRDTERFAGTSREEIRSISEAAIRRAGDALGGWFMIDAAPAIDVTPMAAELEATSPAGFYTAEESGRTAAYVVNLSRPADRRLMAEVIALHEGPPGHHMQLAYGADAAGSSFNSGFIEGWAIYAEYLADEMGLYSSALDRQGMIAKHLWAASRLVIEPKLMTGQWTRDQAIDFMRTRTALSIQEIEIEIDRYYAMPAQSLSYMLGRHAFQDMRDSAQALLGEDFDIREFHDWVLAGGSRPLSSVREEVMAKTQEKLAQRPR